MEVVGGLITHKKPQKPHPTGPTYRWQKKRPDKRRNWEHIACEEVRSSTVFRRLEWELEQPFSKNGGEQTEILAILEDYSKWIALLWLHVSSHHHLARPSSNGSPNYIIMLLFSWLFFQFLDAVWATFHLLRTKHRLKALQSNLSWSGHTP